MFRNGLLATTAIVVVGSLSFLAAQSAEPARSATLEPSRDRNAEFLCTYGDFDVSHTHDGHSGGSFYIAWTHVAARFTGHGQTVSTISVLEARPSNGAAKTFSAGIYSSSNGRPGTLIAGGIGDAPAQCGIVTIPIAPTTLAKNTTYWLEETADLRGNNRFAWGVDPGAKHKAFVQKHFASSYYRSSGLGSSTTPWEKQGSGPWFGLK